MSKSFFELEEFRSRQRRTRAAMQEKKLDLLLVTSAVNLLWLIGASTKAYQVFQCLFFTADERPLKLTMRLSDVAEARAESLADEVRGWGGTKYEDPIDVFTQIFRDLKLPAKARIGLEMPAYYLSVQNYIKVQNALSSYTVVDATNLVEQLKVVKSPAEIAYVRRAAQIADLGLKAIEQDLAIGKTERDVAATAHGAMMAAGGDSPASPMNFCSGERSCYSHGIPSDRVLKAGDFMHIEFGGAYRRYCSTVARHFCMGKPSSEQKKIHDVTRAACDAAISVVKPGVLGETVHLAAVDVIRKAGLEKYNVHTTGYGIAPGFPPSWGESTNLFYGSKDILKAGMVVSIEPPVFNYDDGLGGRLIDCVLIKDGGAEILSQYSRDLIVI